VQKPRLANHVGALPLSQNDAKEATSFTAREGDLQRRENVEKLSSTVEFVILRAKEA